MPLLRDELQNSVGSEYTIERELGGGGMSRVFLALENRLGRRVVLKVLAPDLSAGLNAERFDREIQLAARLQEPHIIPIISTGLAAGLPYYTMPFVAGESLRARITATAPASLEVGDSIAILRDIATALEYAHAHGIVHRDIKPENVLLAGRTAVVTDFGIAKALSVATDVAHGRTLTQAGVSLGTPGYMAPEQALGESVDQRTDIYAWGVIAYELLAGEHPFASRKSAQQVIAAHITEMPSSLHRVGVPAPLCALVMCCLAKDPTERPQSAGALVGALDQFASGARDRFPTPGGIRLPTGRTRYVAAVLGALMVGGLALAWTRTKATTTTSPAGATDITTVAVLPFVNTGGSATDEYFSEGMTDELAHALSGFPTLRVAARSSSYSLKGRTLSAEDVGKALHVGAVVEGSVRRAGNRLRVTAELARTTDGLVLWSETYESRATDVFEVQDQFTKAIVTALAPALSGRTAAAVASASRGTASPEAYDLYLRGRYFWNKRTADGLERSVEYLSKAIERDPRYALAYAGLADSYAVLAAFSFREPRGGYELAKRAAIKALELDSTLAEAHAALGFVRLSDLDPGQAQQEFARAIALDPGYATAHLFNGWNKLVREGPDAAVRELEVAQQREPLSLIINIRLGTMLRYAQRYGEAERQLRKTLDMDSSFAVTYDEMARVLALRGDYQGAIVNARRAVSLGLVSGYGILGYALARNGMRSEAEGIARDLVRQSRTKFVSPSDIGLVYTGLGATSSAVEWLAKCFDVRDQETLHLRIDPLFASLRGDPRFVALSTRAR